MSAGPCGRPKRSAEVACNVIPAPMRWRAGQRERPRRLSSGADHQNARLDRAVPCGWTRFRVAGVVGCCHGRLQARHEQPWTGKGSGADQASRSGQLVCRQRPRGLTRDSKARDDVEFGAKISVSVRNGFAFLKRINWDPYKEAKDLIPPAKKYKKEYGCNHERICADCIYINTKNYNFCTRNDIRLSGKRLVRAPKNPGINAAQKQQLSTDQRRRNKVGR